MILRLKYLLFFLALNVTLSAFATGAPAQSTVDQWIQEAQAAEQDQLDLKGSGPFTCENEIQSDSHFIASNDSAEKAQKGYLLQCLQYQCRILGQRVHEATQKIIRESDGTLTNLMENQGYTPSEIESALKAKKNQISEHVKKINCSNATPLARTFVFDTCSSLPIRCYRN